MLSLLSQFQLSPSLVTSLSSTSCTLTVLKILSNVASYARSVVSSGSSNSRTCHLIFSPSLMEAVDSLPGDGLPTSTTSRLASLGLLVMTTRSLAAQLTRSQAEVTDLVEREQSVPSLPASELAAAAGVAAGDKLPAATLRCLATTKIQEAAAEKRQEVANL